MKNTFNKLTQSLFEAFKGPRTKDFEYEKILQEYQICKERMLSLKSAIDNYPSRLEGYQTSINKLVSNFETIFDKEQGNYYQFMSNVVGAHKALNEKLLNMFSRVDQLKNTMSKWTENCTSVDGKINLREEKRKNFDHYDEKMAEMLQERNKIISKGKIPGEKDDEKYVRNIKKYQAAANEYVEATNDAFKHMGYFLDSRYDNISVSVVDFIEIEAAFYNEASYIFNFFKNCRNNIMALRQNFAPTKREYEASNFIRGKSLLDINVDEMMKNFTSISGVIEGKPGHTRKSSNTGEMNRAKTMNQNSNMNNNNNFNQQQRTNTLFDPYGNSNNNNNRNNNYNNYNNNNYNNNNYNNRNFAPNPYGNKNNFDNSIPDPFANNGTNNGYADPYGNNNNDNNNNNSSNINPYNQGNTNLGDNPFDHPNV